MVRLIRKHRSPFESGGIPLCGGEEVALSGTIFTVTHMTEGPDGKFQLRVDYFGLQKTTAVGLETGSKYILKEADQTVTVDKEISDNEFEDHAIVNGQLIGQGKAPNTGFLLTFQLVVGSDGQVNVESVHENTRC
jgi:hypothetical protein